MGVTWEAAPYVYFKRAKSSELLFGDAAHHRERWTSASKSRLCSIIRVIMVVW
jgi:hypothetical protein